jgi:serine/threonine protein phosphatase PrpC
VRKRFHSAIWHHTCWAFMSAAGESADSESYDPNKELDGTKGICQGLSFGVSMRQGSRPYMEDVTVAQAVPGHNSYSVRMLCPQLSFVCSSFSPPKRQLFCVFDGHGGKRAADFAKEHLPNFLSTELTTDASDPSGCLIRAFEKTDVQFMEDNEVS